MPDPKASAEVNRGAYLVQALGHCGECHTPRNFLGGPKKDRFLAGGKGPEGKNIPNLTPTRLKKLSDGELKDFLTTGMTPDGDVIAEAMGEVVTNTTSKLTPAGPRGADRVPAHAAAAPGRAEVGKRARRPGRPVPERRVRLDQEARPRDYYRGEKAGAAERGPDTGVARSATR